MNELYKCKDSDSLVVVYNNYSGVQIGYLISYINTPFYSRNKGQASKILSQICEDSDLCRQNLYLEPSPFGEDGIDVEGLRSWYSRFGFVNNGPYFMKRKPKEDE